MFKWFVVLMALAAQAFLGWNAEGMAGGILPLVCVYRSCVNEKGGSREGGGVRSPRGADKLGNPHCRWTDASGGAPRLYHLIAGKSCRVRGFQPLLVPSLFC